MTEHASPVTDPARRGRAIFVPAIEAFADELPRGRRRRELHELARALRQEDPADAAVTSPAARVWLPALTSGLVVPSAAMRVSDWMAHASHESHINQRRRRVLIYPAVVLLLALTIFLVLSQAIVVPFIDMFDEFGLRVGSFTTGLFFVVGQLHEHPVRSLSFLIGSIAVVWLLARLWFRQALSTRLFGTFSAGNTANVTAMASLVGSLAELLEAGVPLPESLELAGRGSTHRHYQRVSQQLGLYLRQGHRALQQSPYARSLPDNVILALQPAGAPPNTALLRELAAIYRERAIERTEWSSGLLGAFAVFAVGMVVAVVVVALFLPLVQLTGALS